MTLTIHNPISLSLRAQGLPLSQIFPTTDSLQASGLTPRTLWLDRFFWASRSFVFSFFVTLSCLVPCGRLSWLFVSFRAHVNIVYYKLSYRIVSRTYACRWSVCGSDGKMYASECLMKAESCRRQVEITAQPLESCGGERTFHTRKYWLGEGFTSHSTQRNRSFRRRKTVVTCAIYCMQLLHAINCMQ